MPIRPGGQHRPLSAAAFAPVRVLLRWRAVRRTSKTSEIVILSASRETARELQQYFQAAGVPAVAHTDLSRSPVAACERALVLFPDDFAERDVIAHLQSVRGAWPAARLVVVTARPQRFERAVARDGSALGLIALPRPAFGWAILEAIRAGS